MDIDIVRNQFPIFRQTTQPFVYLDNAATTQKPDAVIERLIRYYSSENANIDRSSYYLSTQASALYYNAKECVKHWINAKSHEEIIFTKGCTESINLVASSIFQFLIKPGDNIIVSELEHSSNYAPWKYFCEKNNVLFQVASVNDNGILENNSIFSLINKRTRFIAITAMSNVTGFCPQLKSIIEEAHKWNIPVLVDAAQAIAHSHISVTDLDCDFLCFSGHKLYAPMGIGVLYGKKGLLEKMPPYQYGGGMIKQYQKNLIHYRLDSKKFEAGTQNIAGILGLESALTYLNSLNFDSVLSYEEKLAHYLRLQLSNIPEIEFVGSTPLSPILAFKTKKLGAYDIGSILSQKGIAIRCGSLCAYPLITKLGGENLCRISLALYNTTRDIDILADSLEKICRSNLL